jgi:hypothetical protein
MPGANIHQESPVGCRVPAGEHFCLSNSIMYLPWLKIDPGIRRKGHADARVSIP